PLHEKLRSAIILAFLKFSPYFSLYEKQTAEEFLKKTMGKNVWNVLWQELFRKKFGKYAENIVAGFIWARINKRTKKLGYVKGGFQTFINFIANVIIKQGVEIKKGVVVNEVTKKGEAFIINSEQFDGVISTLPTLVMVKLTNRLFPSSYLRRFSKLNYLHAVVLILETKEPIFNKTYWLNVCTSKLPLMIVAQHTNFIDKQYYGHNHIAYVGWYVDNESKLLSMNQKEMVNFVLPYLRILNPKLLIHNSYLFKGPFAQPVFDKEFVKNKPSFKTPIKNFYIANLDMTYPYDRGTNYAVKLGRDIAKIV
ncbi:hypothetical protein HY041_01300, partial [Candidatus Roizmanbacteria bacterium]|nr:hypothetical protein [Candidatus Roizmanbacteria bacterium]